MGVWQICIQLIKSDSKNIHNVTKYFKQMLFFSTFYLSKNPKKLFQNIKQRNLYYIILKYYCFWCIFEKIKASFVSIKKLKFYNFPNLWKVLYI